MSLKQRKIKIKPKIKLNHNIHTTYIHTSSGALPLYTNIKILGYKMKTNYLQIPMYIIKK